MITVITLDLSPSFQYPRWYVTACPVKDSLQCHIIVLHTQDYIVGDFLGQVKHLN